MLCIVFGFHQFQSKVCINYNHFAILTDSRIKNTAVFNFTRSCLTNTKQLANTCKSIYQMLFDFYRLIILWNFIRGGRTSLQTFPESLQALPEK